MPNETQALPSDMPDTEPPFSFPTLRVVQPEDVERLTAAKVEPTMRTLRRILGDYVLNIFPEGLTAIVDELHKAWQADPKAWNEAEYDTAQERNDALALMRAYAECAGTDGYTIRQATDTPETVLRFRVTVRRGTAKDE